MDPKNGNGNGNGSEVQTPEAPVIDETGTGGVAEEVPAETPAPAEDQSDQSSV